MKQAEQGVIGMDWQDDLALITLAARQAAETALSHFGRAPTVWWKNEGRSPVSDADFAANQVLSDILRAARPGYGWLSEETDDDPARLDHDTVFVVDPIDGTRAFIAGRKTWCVSVAIVHQGQPVAGILVAPALEEEFTATLDGPSLRNGTEISVSSAGLEENLKFASAQDMVSAFSPPLRARIERVDHVPSLAYRLALVADGRIDATLVKRNASDWDLAAADLILRRAGGALLDLHGNLPQYNKPDVTHPALCAASKFILPGLLKNMVSPDRS